MMYTQNEGRMFVDITDGVAVIIDSDTGVYYGMNGFGSAIFEIMTRGSDFTAIVESTKKLNGCPSDIENKLKDFVDYLVAEEIVFANDKAGSETIVMLDEKTACSDNFDLICTKYTDAQEMILADPIHEVSENVGWTPDKSSLNQDENDVEKRKSKMGL